MKELTLVCTVFGAMLGIDVCLIAAYCTYRSYIRKVTGQHDSPRWREASKITRGFLALSNFVLIIALSLSLRDVENYLRRICPHKANRAECSEAIQTWRKTCCWLAIPVTFCISMVLSSRARAQIVLQRHPYMRFSAAPLAGATILLQMAFTVSIPLDFPNVFFRNIAGELWITWCIMLGFTMITLFVLGVSTWVDGLVSLYVRPRNPPDGVQEGEFFLLRRVGPRTSNI